MSSNTVKLITRWQYSITFCGFAASGWSFVFGHIVTDIQFLIGIVILVTLLNSMYDWDSGPPNSARRQQ